MENDRFQELVLEHLNKLAQGQTEITGKLVCQEKNILELQNKLSKVESKSDLVYNYVVQITETQTDNSNRIIKLEKTTASLAEMYGKHEVEIKNIKSILS